MRAKGDREREREVWGSSKKTPGRKGGGGRNRKKRNRKEQEEEEEEEGTGRGRSRKKRKEQEEEEEAMTKISRVISTTYVGPRRPSWRSAIPVGLFLYPSVDLPLIHFHL